MRFCKPFQMGLVMCIQVRRPAFRRAFIAVPFAAVSVLATATANPFAIAENPRRVLAVHDFGEEHAHLADSQFDEINPLILAALPRGKSHIEFRAPANCVPASLKAVLSRVSAKYGPITVNSTYRSAGKNRKVGGKGHSMHLACRAVDFRVHGSSRGLMPWLAAQQAVGGYNRYPSGFYHIDNGPKRTW
jgi:uncharacterized protein YcbK (DUF882 family)